MRLHCTCVHTSLPVANASHKPTKMKSDILGQKCSRTVQRVLTTCLRTGQEFIGYVFTDRAMSPGYVLTDRAKSPFLGGYLNTARCTHTFRDGNSRSLSGKHPYQNTVTRGLDRLWCASPDASIQLRVADLCFTLHLRSLNE